MALELLANCAHSKILQNVAKFRPILILFRIAKRSIVEDFSLLRPKIPASND